MRQLIRAWWLRFTGLGDLNQVSRPHTKTVYTLRTASGELASYETYQTRNAALVAKVSRERLYPDGLQVVAEQIETWREN